MQKLGFTPRGMSSCRRRLLPHQGLEQKKKELTHSLTVLKSTHRTITQAENKKHCKPRQNTAAELANTEQSPERAQLHEKKEGMSKYQKATASIQHLSQLKRKTIHSLYNLKRSITDWQWKITFIFDCIDKKWNGYFLVIPLIAKSTESDSVKPYLWLQCVSKVSTHWSEICSFADKDFWKLTACNSV